MFHLRIQRTTQFRTSQFATISVSTFHPRQCFGTHQCGKMWKIMPQKKNLNVTEQVSTVQKLRKGSFACTKRNVTSFCKNYLEKFREDNSLVHCIEQYSNGLCGKGRN